MNWYDLNTFQSFTKNTSSNEQDGVTFSASIRTPSKVIHGIKMVYFNNNNMKLFLLRCSRISIHSKYMSYLCDILVYTIINIVVHSSDEKMSFLIECKCQFEQFVCARIRVWEGIEPMLVHFTLDRQNCCWLVQCIRIYYVNQHMSIGVWQRKEIFAPRKMNLSILSTYPKKIEASCVCSILLKWDVYTKKIGR